MHAAARYGDGKVIVAGHQMFPHSPRTAET